MNSREGLKVVESRAFSLPHDDIDTDQIFPAEFLATTGREGLGRYCFHYWRFDARGDPIDHGPFADFDPNRQQILVTGNNFGCGSSREHAPWALLQMGFLAVISRRFADIFYGNALKNGLLPVTLEKAAVDFLHDNPGKRVKIDVPSRTVTIEDYGTLEFSLDPFSALCLIEGIDQMEFLLQQEALIDDFEQTHQA